MATGPEHYRESERILKACTTDKGALFDGHSETLALAQVHATLALAAALGGLHDFRSSTGEPYLARTEESDMEWMGTVEPR